MGQYPVPLVILDRLAVDLGYQKRGLGFSLLHDAITRTVAVTDSVKRRVRALLTHPIDAQADAFYRRFGFEPTPRQCVATELVAERRTAIDPSVKS